MTENEFDSEMEKLTECFGANAFNKQRLIRIFGFCRDLPRHEFAQVINSFIDQLRQAPMPKDFREAAQKFRGARLAGTDVRYECKYCGGSGLISAFKKGQRSASYSFRCPDRDCEAAKVKCNRYDVTWGPRFEAEYVPAYTDCGNSPEQAFNLAVNQGVNHDAQ